MTKAQESPRAAIPCTVSRSGRASTTSLSMFQGWNQSAPFRWEFRLSLSWLLLFFFLGFLARFGPTLSIQEPLELPGTIPGGV